MAIEPTLSSTQLLTEGILFLRKSLQEEFYEEFFYRFVFENYKDTLEMIRKFHKYELEEMQDPEPCDCIVCR